MAEIKKIYDDAALTTQIYPQTHEKAVIDNNGVALDSKLGMITELVNQKQMEVGAVPSDIAPTKGSSNWVTSGGTFEAIDNAIYGYKYTPIDTSALTSCGGTIRSLDNLWVENTQYYGALIDVTQYDDGARVNIKKNTNGNDLTYTFLTGGYVKNQRAQFASGYSSVIVSTADVEVEIPSNAVYLYVYLQSNNVIYTPSAITFIEDGIYTKVSALDGVGEKVDALDSQINSQDDELKIAGGSIPSCGGTIVTSTNKWMASTVYYGGLIRCESFRGKTCMITKGTGNTSYTFLVQGFSDGDSPQYASGYDTVIVSSTDVNTVVPSDAVYLYVYLKSGNTDYRPVSVQLGVEGLLKKVNGLEESIAEVGAGNSFRIASYNIGHFSHGASQNSSITSTDYDVKLAAYRQLIYGKLGADVIGLCEYSAVFGNNGSGGQQAEDVLFNRYDTAFIGEQIRYSCNAIYSNLFIENMVKSEFDCNEDVDISHTDLIEATDYYYLEADLWLGGVKIKLIMTHLAFDNNDTQVVGNQIDELITKFASEERVIMMGDWNVAEFSQFDAFTDAGYTLSNIGSPTYSDTSPTKALDNIIVKGVGVSQVKVVSTTGLSDHLPIITTITLDTST